MAISNKFKIAIKLSDKPAYKIAQEVGMDPNVLSKMLCGIIKVKRNDKRVLRVARVLGLKPEECFEEGENNES